jgi:outer membrane protein OmpA-like peptidoglycan-associated protein
MPSRSRLLAVVVPLAVAACGTINPQGDIPKSSPLIADANLRVSPNYSITIEKIVYGAAGAALLYWIYDPLAPNWEVREEQVAEDTYRLSLRMKRFHIGGEGEASQVFRRWANNLQREGEASGYQIRDFVEGIESTTPIARRYAEGTVRLTRQAQAGDAVALAPLPVPAVVGDAVAVATATAPAGDAARDDRGRVERKPLPRPPPLGDDLLGLAHEATLDARALFEFDQATLTASGKAVLERELVARRGRLGRLTLLLVSGHADRIGSYEYNQRLSQARASAVRDYLVSRGFARDTIQTAAYGKARPLAGIVCSESLSREAQIACLAPQRRVEVSAGER